MLKTSRHRLHLIIVAILLQVLSAGSSQPSSQSKVTKLSPQDGSPKLQAPEASMGRRTRGLSSHLVRRAGRKEDPAKRFQSRMMTAVGKELQSGSIKRQDTISDSWQSQPLVPTFTDQEQGDEMVALASDQAEQEDIRSSRANRSMPMGGAKLPEQRGQMLSRPDKMFKDAVNKALMNAQDQEYEADEDEDIEDEPGRSLNPMVGGEYGSATSAREPKGSQAIQQVQKFKPPTQSGPKYTDHVAQSDQVANLSSGSGLIKAIDSGWMPTSNSSPPPSPAAEPSAVKSPDTTRERLAGFFGGREGFSKADVAIEYLRSMLKNKQNQSNNSTQNGLHLQEHPDKIKELSSDTNTDRGLSYDRISMLTSRLNRILNATNVQVNNNTSEQSKLAEPISHQISNIATQMKLSPHLPPVDLNGDAQVRQADSRFSISDAKSLSQFDFEKLQQQQHLPSTKLPGDRVVYSSEPAQDGSPTRSTPQIYSDQTGTLSTIPANGTPLGGDYIEGLDDYPRYAQEHQLKAFVQQRPSLQESQSRLVPMRQELSKAEQKALRSHDQQNSAQLAEGHQKSPQGGLPESLFNLQRQYEGPRSSRYFQMHQAQAHGEQGASKNYLKQENDASSSSPKIINHGHANKQSAQESNNQSEPAGQPKSRNEELREVAHGLQQSNHQERTLSQDQTLRPSSTQPTMTGRKTYGNSPVEGETETKGQQQVPAKQHQVSSANEQPAGSQARQPAKARPPKIVSYNYFESPNEGKESELMATNYQLADALYSSTGELGQMLSNTELEAIQSQFLTSEHPIVPIAANDGQSERFRSSGQHNYHHQDQSLAGLLSNLRPEDYPHPEALQKLVSPAKHNEDAIRELASDNQATVSLAPAEVLRPPKQTQGGADELKRLLGKSLDPADNKKRKSLIVYLNHPRPVDMSRQATVDGGLNLSQSIGDQPPESFISAKEFDTQGLSKDTKHLDVSNLSGFGGESKEAQDKDGLSVVVIGDAYKYKKIVLLISSKTGGLRFIPMVKDMKK